MSGLALSFISGFVFRELVVARPERRRQARITARNWGPLCLVAYNAQGLVHDLEIISADRTPRPYNDRQIFLPIEKDYFSTLTEPLPGCAVTHFGKRIRAWQEAWDQLKPYLHEFSEQLVVKLRVIESVPAIRTTANAMQPDSMPVGKSWHGMWEYIDATEQLRAYLATLPLEDKYLDDSPRFHHMEEHLRAMGYSSRS